MHTVAGPRRRLRHAARAEPECAGALWNGSMRPTRATRCTPAAPPESPRACSATPAATAVALAASMKHIFLGNPGETYFSTSDIGWVVGHSYIIYGPLIAGMATIMYEGLPIRPDAAIWWSLVEKYKVTVMFKRSHRGASAEEAGPGRAQAGTTCRACARSSSPASRSMNRPRSGSPNRSASRSSTTIGRPRPAGRSSASATASRRRRASSARPARRSTATTSSCSTRPPARN